jgi:hypothetical protein
MTKKPTAGDILKLYRAYTSDSPPPISYIRHADIMGFFFNIEAFICDLFLAGRVNTYINEKMFLLASASCGSENVTL